MTARGDPCLLHGLVELRFIDTVGHEIVRTQPSAPGTLRDWAMVGDAQVQWQLNNWCDPRVDVGSVVVALLDDPTPVVADLDPPMRVGARCDSPDSQRGATTISVAPWPTAAPAVISPRATLTAHIEAPATAIAGETLRYLVTLTNVTGETLALDPCPSYIEWLGGHPLPTATPPNNWPSFKIWTPVVEYGGIAKESHLLNCQSASSIAHGESITFEMRLAVPADAIGSDTLRWQVIGRVGAPGSSAPITIVAR
jgi:hypothetical protein